MLFLSHSTHDKEHAKELKRRLLERGYSARQLFLDSDAESGITAGTKWEEQLYEHLGDCQALLVVCSAHLPESKWCFAEIFHAKAHRKPLFPVFIEDCAIESITADHQAVFVHKELDLAYERLFAALEKRKLGPTDIRVWEGECPYPGLLAFDESLADVYFGRETETRELRAKLSAMRTKGLPRLLMITGGSGSGKSSLLKAGLLPLLRHKTAEREWIVLPVLRHGECGNQQDTIFHRLAMNLAAAFPETAPYSGGLAALRGALSRGTADSSAEATLEILQELAHALRRGDATVLLPIDQFEELLAPAAGEPGERFLEFLKALFHGANGRLLGIGTLRSDYLDLYERHSAAIEDPHFLSWRLGPLPQHRIREVILKPARIAKVEIDEALLARLEYDTSSNKALPLLAFTLEKLYKKYADDGKLELAEYEEIDGLEGSIQHSIERIIPPGSLTAEQEDALRLSFVAHLVQLGDDNRPVRKVARLESLPAAARELIDELIKERLLSSSDSEGESTSTAAGVVTVEVAHEALFRRWDLLKQWLADSHKLHRWRRDVARDRANDAKKWTGLRPAQLAIGRDLLKTGRKELEEDEVKWIEDGIRRQRRKVSAIISAFTLIVALAGISLSQARVAVEQKRIAKDSESAARLAERDASRKSRHILTQKLAFESRIYLDATPRKAAIWAAEALRATPNDSPIPAEAAATVQALLSRAGGTSYPAQNSPTDFLFAPDENLIAAKEWYLIEIHNLSQPPSQSLQHVIAGKVHGEFIEDIGALVAFDGTSERLITHSTSARGAAVWELEKGRQYVDRRTPLADGESFQRLAASPDNRKLAAAGEKGIRIYHLGDISKRTIERFLDYEESDSITVMEFSPDGRYLLSGSLDGWVQIWDFESPLPRPLYCVQGDVGPIASIKLSADGSSMVVSGRNDSESMTQLWSLGFTPRGDSRTLVHRGGIDSIDFLDENGSSIIAKTGSSGLVQWWAGQDPKALLPASPALESVHAYDIFRKGNVIALGRTNGTVAIADTRDLLVPATELRGPDSAARRLKFSPHGNWLVVSDFSSMHVWRLNGGKAPLPWGALSKRSGTGHTEYQISQDGSTVALWGRDQLEILEWTGAGSSILMSSDPAKIQPASHGKLPVWMSPDGRWIAVEGSAGGGGYVLRQSSASQGIPLPVGTDVGWFSPDSHWLVLRTGKDAFLCDLTHSAQPLPLAIPPGEGAISLESHFADAGGWFFASFDSPGDRPERSYLFHFESGKTGSRPSEASHSEDLGACRAVFSRDGAWVAFVPDPDSSLPKSTGPKYPLRVMHLDQATGDRGQAIPLAGFEAASYHLEFSPDGRWLLAATSSWERSRGSKSCLWDLAGSKLLAGQPDVLPDLKFGLTDVVFSPDGRFLVTAEGMSGELAVWRCKLDSGQFQKLGEVAGTARNKGQSIQFSPDSEKLVILSGGSSRPCLWFLHEDRPPTGGAKLRAESGILRQMSFSADSSILYLLTSTPAEEGAKTHGSQIDAVDVRLEDRQPAAIPVYINSQEARGFLLAEKSRTLFVYGESLWAWPLMTRQAMMSRLVALAGRNMSWSEWSSSGLAEPYRKTFKDFPVDSSVLLELAVRLQEGEERPSGLSYARIAEWTIEADIPNISQRMAMAFLKQRRGEFAIRTIEPALEHFPANADYLALRGAARAMEGDLKGASQDFEESIRNSDPLEVSKETLGKRQQWLQELAAGINPFAAADFE